jgi:ABC-2 type transport system ATP-binding protein
MQDGVVIKVEGVYKDFILPHERAGTVKGVFTSMFSKATRKSETLHALKDISFDIRKGEFFGIVGRNGSGKSTLLKILAGIYQPTKGKVSTYGKLVPFIELGVGFNPELSGRDNVYLNGAVLGFSKNEVAAMYEDIVSFAELSRFMDQKLKNYSSGMQVRLAFSMAVRAKADILLIDEVLAVGDADFQRKCFDYFRQLKGDGTTVVFVSHNMNAVREYCGRAMLIDENKVIEIGDSDAVAKLYSRMFIEQSASSSEKDKVKVDDKARWGDRSVLYSKVGLSTGVLSDQKDLVLTLTANAKKNIDGVIFGFSIKNSAQQIILGTNSQLKRQKVKQLQEGEKVTISWLIPNIFSDGQYVVDSAITLTNGVVCDWWEAAASFTVAKEDHASYLTEPDINLTVSY